MKAKEIRDLIDFISNSGLDEVNIETQEFKIAVKKNTPVVNHVESQAVVPATAEAVQVPVAQVPAAAPAPAAPATPEPAPKEESKFVEIKSPMIGTFYNSSNPESDPYVKEGSEVKVGQTVCIVEAMKLFNEIESEFSGKVVKVLVENASPVEYDQPLFLVDPS